MSDETKRRPRLADPTAPDYSGLGGAFGEIQEPGNQGSMVEWRPPVGPAVDRAMAAHVTAQRVAVKRDVPRIIQEAKAIATAAGDQFYYRIPYREKEKDEHGKETGRWRTVYVEGPTIGCAMAAVNIYGNCSVDVGYVEETPTHWMFPARFIDLEKGVTVTRQFRQRRGQKTGMKDAGRQEDMVFQIGQSKAMRNVVKASLEWLLREMESAAKNGILGRIDHNPDGARKFLLEQYAALDIDVARVNRIIGRAPDKWLVPDMAKLFAELNAIKDGMADADDLYPEADDEAEELAAANKKERSEEKKPAAKKESTKEKPRDDTAKADGAKDHKPEPAGDQRRAGPSGDADPGPAADEGGEEESAGGDAEDDGVGGEASADEGTPASDSPEGEGEEDQGDLLIGD